MHGENREKPSCAYKIKPVYFTVNEILPFPMVKAAKHMDPTERKINLHPPFYSAATKGEYSFLYQWQTQQLE